MEEVEGKQKGLSQEAAGLLFLGHRWVLGPPAARAPGPLPGGHTKSLPLTDSRAEGGGCELPCTALAKGICATLHRPQSRGRQALLCRRPGPQEKPRSHQGMSRVHHGDACRSLMVPAETCPPRCKGSARGWEKGEPLVGDQRPGAPTSSHFKGVVSPNFFQVGG